MSAAQPQTVEPRDDSSKTVKIDWTVTFKQQFDVPHPLTQDQFIVLGKEHLEWLKADFLKQLETYPAELLKTLGKYGLLELDTFKQNGRGEAKG